MVHGVSEGKEIKSDRITVLVIDAKGQLSFAIVQKQNSTGMTVITASTAREGLCLTKNVRPDLVVIKEKLPDRSGYELCDAIKSDPELRETFVLLLPDTQAHPYPDGPTLHHKPNGILSSPSFKDKELATVFDSCIQIIKIERELLQKKMGMWEWNVARGIMTLSQETKKIFHLKSSDSKILFSDFLQSICPEDVQVLAKTVPKLLYQKEEVSFQVRMNLPSGQIRRIQCHAIPVQGDYGKVSRVIGTLVDLTDHRQGDSRINVVTEEKELLRKIHDKFRWDEPISVILN